MLLLRHMGCERTIREGGRATGAQEMTERDIRTFGRPSVPLALAIAHMRGVLPGDPRSDANEQASA